MSDYNSGHNFCACGTRAVAACEACSALLCRWHWAQGPFEGVHGTLLRPVCMPACGAPMSPDWEADLYDWLGSKRDAREKLGILKAEG